MRKFNNNNQLPGELHDMIIRHGKDDRSLVLAYGAVCRAWDNAIWPYRKLLFQRVYLTKGNIDSFVALARVSPRVIQCIRVVSVSYPITDSRRACVATLDLSFLAALPNINELRLEELPVTPTLTSSITRTAACIVELEIGMLGAEDSSHFADLVQLFTSLRRMSIKRTPKLLPSCTVVSVQPAGHPAIDAAMHDLYNEFPLGAFLGHVNQTTQTIHFGEEAICASIKCVCLDDEAVELMMANGMKPVPHAKHLSSLPNLRHIEFDLTLGIDGWGYDIAKLLSDGFIQNLNIETLRIHWDVTKHSSDLFRSLAIYSVLLLESMCEALSARVTQFRKLRNITFEAFADPKAERQISWLPLGEADRESFDWLVKYLRKRLPCSDDDTVQCYSVRSLDMSKIEIEVGMRVSPPKGE